MILPHLPSSPIGRPHRCSFTETDPIVAGGNPVRRFHSHVAHLATSPSFWRTAMTMSKAMNHLPIQVAPIKPLQDWLGQRTLPESHGGDFRKWMKNRKPVHKS